MKIKLKEKNLSCLICGIRKSFSVWPMCNQELRQNRLPELQLKDALQEHIWTEMISLENFKLIISCFYSVN